MTTVDNLNGLELLSGRLVTLFLTLAEAEEAVKSLPAGTHVKVTNDPNPDLNGEYTWDGEKLLKTTNNTLEKAKEQAEEVAQEIIDRNVTASHVLDLLEGQITGSLLDRRLEQRIEKIPSIVGEIEELKNEVTTINYDLGVKVNYINFDLEKLTQYVEELELIVDVDFSEIKQQIQDLHDQVNSDFEAVRVKIDELQAQVTADFEKVRQEVKDLQAQVDADIKKLQKEVADKFLEVDQIKIGLDKEIQDRISAVKAETEARVESIRLLNDGLTKEIQERKDGDQKLLTNIENYKTSNDKSLANVREQVTVAVDTANASAQKVDALDARVVSAENNSKTALENSASAVSKVTALASDVGAMSEKVDTLEANVIKAVDDSGKALTNSATAISQSKTAVDKANAVSEQVNIVEAKLNDKSTTYRTNIAPTKATHPNLSVGDVWINQDKKNEQKRWDGKAWVDINDVRVSDNATAISKTNATVTEQGKTIQANVQKIDSLTASLGDKADASALTKLESTVTKQGTDIQTNSANITSLQGQIKDKADAKALNELSTKVTEQGGTIASQGQSITALNNQIKDKADASAVTQLTSTVTKQGETINAQGKQITTLEGKVDGKADATAVTELKATVTEHEGKIATQGQAITSLNNQIKDKADTKAVTALETKVTKQGEDITAQGKQITSVEAQLKDKASTQAVSTLDAKVNKQGETITAQGQALTGLKQEVDGKASVQAVDELKTTVTQQGKDITAHGQSLTSLQNQMKDKADAKALTALETKVTKQGDDIKSQGEAITSVEAHLDGMIIGGSNLIRKTDIQAGYLKSYSPNVVTFPALPKARTPVARSLTGSGASVGVNTVSDISLKAGQEYTLSFRGASSKGAFTYAYVMLNKSGASNIPLLLNNKPVSKVESVLTYVSATFKCTHDVDTAHIMFACNGAVASDWVLVAEPMLVEGNTGTTWSKSIDELAGSEALNELKATVGKQGETITAQGQSITGLKQEVDGKASSQAVNELKSTVTQQGKDIATQGQAITTLNNQIKDKADAKALTALETKVTENSGKIESQGTALTGVKASLGAMDSDSLLPDYNLASPDEWFSHYGYKMEQYFKTTPNGKVGNTVFRHDSSNPQPCWNYNKKPLPNDRKYKVTAKVKRSTDSVGGSNYITVLYGTPDGKWSSANYTYVGIVPKASGEWEDVEAIVNLTSNSDKYPQIKIGFAINHNSTAGMAELQGFKVVHLIETGDVGSSIATAESVSKLSATVTQQGNTITSQGTAITGLENSIKDKADAKAVNELKTTVEQQGNDIKSQGLSITKVEASVKDVDIIAKDSKLLAMYQGQGKLIWDDPTFKKSDNSIKEYGKNNAIHIVDRVPVGAGNPTGSTHEILDKIVGDINLGNFGIYPANLATAIDKVFLHKYVAKIPTNYRMTKASNAIGVGGIDDFIGDTTGTGNYEVYWRLTRCGQSGTFSTTGHVALKRNSGAIPTPAKPDEVRFAQVAIFDVTDAPDSIPKELLDKVDANSKAISSLDAEVKRVDGVVVAQGKQVTQLTAEVNKKADGTALTALETKVTQQGKDITSQGQSITNLNNQIKDKADASAVNSLKTTVDQQGNDIKTNSQNIINLNTNLGKKADASAVTALEAEVKKVDGKTVTNSQSITKLQGQVNTIDGEVKKKADASALNSYYTKVEADKAIAGQISEFNSSLVIGGVNQLLDSERERSSSATSQREYFMYERSVYLKDFYDRNLGKPVTISFEIKVPVAGTVQVYSFNNSAHTYSTSTPSLKANEWTYVELTVKPNKHGTTPENVAGSTLEFYGTYGTGRIPSVRRVQLEAGTKATDWSVSPRDVSESLEANSTAVGKVEAKTTALEGKVNTQATQITGLQSQINGKADSSALNSLKTTVEQQGNTISSQGTAITQVESSVNNALKAVTVEDTRSKNELPLWYWTNHPRRVVNEFKTASVIGVTGLGTYVNLETRVYYTDASGGSIIQIAHSANNSVLQMERNSVGSGSTATWSAWRQPLKSIDDSAKASATAVNKLTTDVTKIDGKVDAQATAVQQLDTKVGQNSASIQTQSQTINGIRANWTMKMDVNGYVSGIGAMNDGKTSEFIIRADRFAIANPTGTGKKYGFVYQSSPKTLPNGTVIPAGLYIDNLILGDIDARKINAESISAISANLGRFESSVAGKGKTVISGTEYQVFDANGVERIFLGVR
ncbi:putative tail protein I [Acinetobacter phage vB_AbaM_Acibel004]|uniref:putative tail protein I n=1 Tax=Acinetobacter phage vB_AbaM_Acibel004 TaxID=1481186 RepID=UPI0004E8459F|nr:putative tail protein I [Acinetobacter phage vB_AbaM_Acibel004]AHY26738.1 putative tail protein I [Acinetobacter phage vB_AbaM_Acibel004]